jgi:hypothetical protein
MPVLVRLGEKWAIEDDVKKRQFYNKRIAEDTFEKEKIEKKWIDDWLKSSKKTKKTTTKAWTWVDKNRIDAWVKRVMEGSALKGASRLSGTTSHSVLITRVNGQFD